MVFCTYCALDDEWPYPLCELEGELHPRAIFSHYLFIISLFPIRGYFLI